MRIELYDHRDNTTPIDLGAAEYMYVNVQAGNQHIVRQMRAVLRVKVKFC